MWWAPYSNKAVKKFIFFLQLYTVQWQMGLYEFITMNLRNGSEWIVTVQLLMKKTSTSHLWLLAAINRPLLLVGLYIGLLGRPVHTCLDLGDLSLHFCTWLRQHQIYILCIVKWIKDFPDQSREKLLEVCSDDCAYNMTRHEGSYKTLYSIEGKWKGSPADRSL